MKKKKTNFASFSFTKVVFSAAAIILVIGISIIFANNKSPFCANAISCVKDLSGRVEVGETKGIFMGKTVTLPKKLITQLTTIPTVLGDEAGSGAKHIYVDLSTQRLYAYEGNKLIYNFIISSGKWAPTPTGDFTIWIKLRATRMTGGSVARGDYYDLPNVPYTMYFSNAEIAKSMGYSLHGAYWHNNFGHPMSHGCVNMKIDDAAQIYAWASPATSGSVTYASAANPGTPITIYGTAPTN